MPAPFPRRPNIGRDVADLWATERARSTARGLGYSTLAPGDGWIGITDDTGDEVARAGEQGLWVPDGTGGWILVQVDAQNRADAAQAAAISAAALDATTKADAAQAAAAADATSKANAAQAAAISTAAADATSKANAAQAAAIAHADGLGVGGVSASVTALAGRVTAIENWLDHWFNYPGTPSGGV